MIGLGIVFVVTTALTVDGDTLRARTAPDRPLIGIRLAGINSVERGSPGYREARSNLQSIALGQVLVCEATGVNGDRIVARCRRQGDGLDLGEAQVRAGHASACPAFEPGETYVPLEVPGRPPAAPFCEVKAR